jgi:hypothetical protein
MLKVQSGNIMFVNLDLNILIDTTVNPKIEVERTRNRLHLFEN